MQVLNGLAAVMVFLDLNQDVQAIGRMGGTKAGDFRIWKTIQKRAPVIGQVRPVGHIWTSNLLGMLET